MRHIEIGITDVEYIGMEMESWGNTVPGACYGQEQQFQDDRRMFMPVCWT